MSRFRATAFVVFATAFAVNLPAPLYALYQARWGFSAATLTLVFASIVVGILAVLLGLAGLADQIGRRTPLIAALLLSALGSVIFLAAQSTAWLFAARIAGGLGVGLAVGAATAALVDAHPQGDRDAASLASTATFVGAAGLAPLVAGVCAQFLPAPLELVFGLHLALVAAALLVARGLPDDRRRAAVRPHRPRLSVPAPIRRLFVVNAVGIFAMSAVYGIFAALAATLVRDVLGLSSVAVAGATTFAFLSVSVAAQVRLRRWSARRAASVGLVVVAAGLGVVVAAAAARSFALFAVGTVLAGVGQGMSFLGTVAAVNHAAPPARRAEVMGALFLANYVGFGAPVAVGLLAPSVGLLRATELFGAIIGALALLAGAAIARAPDGGVPCDGAGLPPHPA